MHLYHSQYTRSGRARWILEEIGVPYDITRLSLQRGEHRTPEYLAISPHGSVPALVDGDVNLVESSAILLHLADKFPEARLAPALGSDARADYYRWLVYVPATVDPALEAITRHTRILPEAQRNPVLAEEGRRRLAAILPVLERAVDGRTYVVGDSFTAADIAVASAIGWLAFIGVLADHPKLATYLQPMQQRPAYQRSIAD